VVPFDPKRLPTVFTLGMGRDKGSGLLGYEALLEHCEELLRFREVKPRCSICWQAFS
jgi:hypothetical protein